MKYLIILLLLAGCVNRPATTATKQVNLIKVCDTFGAVRHCEMMTEEEAQMIINRRIIKDGYWDQLEHNFSITSTWDAGIEAGSLFGFVSKNKFSHVTNLDIYKRLLKNN